MRSLKVMLKSVTIPSLTEVRAKMSKTLHGSGEKASRDSYIKVCERALNDEFKELQLFGQQNKDKIKFIEEYYALCKKKGISAGSTGISAQSEILALSSYLGLVGLNNRRKNYKKTYENYNDLINNEFGVKPFMKSFSKEAKISKNPKDFEKLDTKIKERIALMRSFLTDISEKMATAYSTAIKEMEQVKKFGKIDKKAFSKMQEQAEKKLRDARERLQQARTEQNKKFEGMQSDFLQSLRTNKNINFVEQFLIKNKGKVNSYAQIMKYSDLIANHKGAVELFTAKFNMDTLNEIEKDCWAAIRTFENSLKFISQTEGFERYLVVQDLLEKSNPDISIAEAHNIMTKTTLKMKELRDKIILVANEAAKEIEALKIHFKENPNSGLIFQGTGSGIRTGNVSSLRNKFESIARDQQDKKSK